MPTNRQGSVRDRVGAVATADGVRLDTASASRGQHLPVEPGAAKQDRVDLALQGRQRLQRWPAEDVDLSPTPKQRAPSSDWRIDGRRTKPNVRISLCRVSSCVAWQNLGATE